MWTSFYDFYVLTTIINSCVLAQQRAESSQSQSQQKIHIIPSYYITARRDWCRVRTFNCECASKHKGEVKLVNSVDV